MEAKVPQTFHLISDIPVGVAIPIKGSPSPCFIRVKYATKGDLSVYASRKHKEPSLKHCERGWQQNPARCVMLHDKVAEHKSSKPLEFTDSFIYLTLESLIGVTVTLTVKFGRNVVAKEIKLPLSKLKMMTKAEKKAYMRVAYPEN